MDEKVLFRTESKALYTGEEMKRIEKVIRAFYNYLRDSQSCELLWSDKVGYVLLPVNVQRRSTSTEPRIIRDAGDLVQALLDEISRDVAADAGKRRFSRREYPEFQRRVRDYMVQLPEFRGCLSAIASG